MLCLSENNLAAFSNTSRCPDDYLNFDNPYFEQLLCFNVFKTLSSFFRLQWHSHVNCL